MPKTFQFVGVSFHIHDKLISYQQVDTRFSSRTINFPTSTYHYPLLH